MDMIDTINRLVELTAGESAAALVPLNIRAEAYANRPLPIGHGQIHLIPRYRGDCVDPRGGVR